MTDLLFRAARRLFGRSPVQAVDLPPTDPSDDTRRWAVVPPDGLLRAVGPLWIVTAAVLVAHALLAMAAPPLLRAVIAAVRDPSIPWTSGALAAIGLAITSALAWLAVSHGFLLTARVAMRIRASLTRAVHGRAVRQVHPGDTVTNLIAIDVERVASGVADLATLGMSSVSVAVGVALLFGLLGVPALGGLAVLVALLPLSHWRARQLEGAGADASAAADVRLGLLREAIAGIRTVKLSAWEPIVGARIAEPRAREVSATRRYAIHSAWLHALFLGSPVLLLVATFGLQAALGRPLIAADAFAAIALFGLLRPTLLFLPGLVMSVSAARVSMRRIRAFLDAPERPVGVSDRVEAGRVRLSGASFQWPSGAIALKDVDLDVAPGELVAVIGPVGAGKTALISAVLGELTRIAGTADRAGRLAYAGQEPFLINGTVVDNVRFGRAADDGRIARALAAAALDGDAMPASVGERGSRLSGGQRQRVALARALYGEADVVLLDEPVSALDDRVAELVVERAIFGAWQGKTRIVVTSRPSVVERADRVVVVEGGAVTVRGPARVVGWAARPADGDPGLTPSEPEVADEGAGAISGEVYRGYVRRLLPAPVLAGVLALFAVREGFAVGADAWLSWASGRGEAGAGFVVGLCALSAVAVLATWSRGLVVALRGVVVGRALHDEALGGLFAAPLRVFETTPAGRLLQRLGRDQQIVDQQLALILLEAASTLALVASTAAVVVVATPLALALILPAALVGRRIAADYRPASRELRRFEAASHSPMLACVVETLHGAPTIRAFGMEAAFGDRMLDALEPSQRAMFASGVLHGWLSIRLEAIGSALAGFVALAAVLGRARVDPTLASLAITDALLVTYTLGRWVRTWAELEGAMTSVERLSALAALEPEEPGAAATPRALAPRPAGQRGGTVAFEGVDLRYASDAPLALRGVSFTVSAGEKIGVVGRTGSGKSTIAASLVRIVSPERGRIRLDGIDVQDLQLADLRTRVTVVPQEPILFEGRLRDNLDPGGRFDDRRLRAVLDRVGLALDLDATVARGGANLSAGQRQLSCLARALLTEARVVILDEATAHLDPSTEQALREALASALAGVTAITIAHRTETLAGVDRLLVMDGGQLRESAR